MRLVILCVGSLRDRALAEAVWGYEERARHYFRLDVLEVPAASGHGGDPEKARREEGRTLLRRLPEDLEAWALTRTGAGLTSAELAEALGDAATYARPGIVFVVGGAFGLAPDVLERSRRQVSLSSMTLPHEMARLLLVEQIYRAGTILRGEPYHKGA